MSDYSALSPVIVAKGLSLCTPRGHVFNPVTATIAHRSVVAVAGADGSGKSALLLALAGRMRGIAGELIVDGIDAVAHPGRVRKVTSVARIADLVAAEPKLSLEDCITERTLADGASARERHANYLHAALLLGLDEPRDTLFGQLSPADQTRAAIALAAIRPARLVVVDDIDRETTLTDQAALWAGLLALADDGVTVVASTSERAAVPPEALTVEMDPRHA
ncbi:MAG: ATP-binding cassette domain-containing protein [Tessaracoccus sp.]|uniref:ATP-binding cassette domain-containing protein n=1 Tax=Tessaracoccus sp. TaxID=1971211 RepID=UPI001ECD3D61|nr:ATP-binding cassette domain-containing protein [Tessaracoccus sp.]MBK7822261.1 ATP-binding cassette domain-containing protein [Tessaracoccus sp.]